MSDSTKSPTHHPCTPQQDGRFPNSHTPFHLARRVSDIGTLAQGGADVKPTAQSVEEAKHKYMRRKSSTESLPTSTPAPATHARPQSPIAASHDSKISFNKNSFAKAPKDDSLDGKKTSPKHSGDDHVAPTNVSLHGQKDATSTTALNKPQEAKSPTPSDHHHFHFRRPSSSASLEDLIEAEIKDLLKNNRQSESKEPQQQHKDIHSHAHGHTHAAATSTSTPPPQQHSSSSSSSTIPTSSTPQNTQTKVDSSDEEELPQNFERRCSWIPPASGNQDTDNAIEDARARWFSYENFKDLMYSKLHGGTGPSGPGGTGAPSGTATPL